MTGFEEGHEIDVPFAERGISTTIEVLPCRQDNCAMYDYAEKLRELYAVMASELQPEAVMVTVLMEGLSCGSLKTKVFRQGSTTLEYAIMYLVRKDSCHVVNSSSRIEAVTAATGIPEPIGFKAVTVRGK
ncbi:uncharacterized protein PHALS_12279 [Plasmopara halstedii]|uniref:Uncharacterized protein n=1 Tax=Plasmopara halstedii TaxID=4781 RepID=A0A0P1ALJ8_PLAHL|nr:uncharacterized protein PHALS_12279 [Plasmopara halstedii]CEG41972.1 hypothetical protein PHALS_12279 [Plasmopara halstedii]|eukprot:XP_024578341.1 hypothetical protein PHALS_12279 [Plasmopara halstedii]